MSDRLPFPHLLKVAGPASIALFAAGCVTVATPAPTAQLAVARSAIADAVSADALQYDPADVDVARRKLASADDEAARGNDRTAEDLAEEAAVDARLAATRTRAIKAVRAEATVQTGLRALQDEINMTPQ